MASLQAKIAETLVLLQELVEDEPETGLQLIKQELATEVVDTGL